MRVRPASAADILQILPLLEALARSFGDDYPKPDMGCLEENLRDVLVRGFVIVAEGDMGNLIGFLALARGEFPFSRETVLMDRGFYAVPGSQAGAMLLSSARRIAETLGLRFYVTRLKRAAVLVGRCDRP